MKKEDGLEEMTDAEEIMIEIVIEDETTIGIEEIKIVKGEIVTEVETKTGIGKKIRKNQKNEKMKMKRTETTIRTATKKRTDLEEEMMIESMMFIGTKV